MRTACLDTKLVVGYTSPAEFAQDGDKGGQSLGFDRAPPRLECMGRGCAKESSIRSAHLEACQVSFWVYLFLKSNF